MRKLFISITLLILLLELGCSKGPKNYDFDLYPIFKEGKIGFINSKGEIICQPQFEQIGAIFLSATSLLEYYNFCFNIYDNNIELNIFPVKMNGKWGYIDKNGKTVISYQFDEAFMIYEGLACVKSGDKWGYIDDKGSIIIPQTFDLCSRFSEGLAAVKSGDKWGFINKKCKVEIQFQFDDISQFRNGMAAVKIDDKWSYINKEGKIIKTPEFSKAAMFINDDMAAVCVDGKYGFINKKLEYVINPQFDGIDYMYFEDINDGGIFSEGLCLIKNNGKFGYVDTDGKYIINAQFDFASPFSEGLAVVVVGKKFGYIDKKGAYIINPMFDVASMFVNGVALVRINSKIGYINKKGEYIIQPRFDKGFRFMGKLTSVIENDNLLYINTDGVVVYSSKNPDAGPEAEAKALMIDMTKVTEEAAAKIEKAATEKEIGDVLVAYAVNMKRLAARGKDLEKKFPDYKPDENDKFKSEQDAMTKSTEKFTAAMTSCMKKYPGSQEITDASVKMAEIMKN